MECFYAEDTPRLLPLLCVRRGRHAWNTTVVVSGARGVRWQQQSTASVSVIALTHRPIAALLNYTDNQLNFRLCYPNNSPYSTRRSIREQLSYQWWASFCRILSCEVYCSVCYFWRQLPEATNRNKRAYILSQQSTRNILVYADFNS